MFKKIPWKVLLEFLLPFLAWAYLFKGFLAGSTLLRGDSFAIFAVIQYYLANLTTGVVPVWNPYSLWGMVHLFQVGELNPIWMIASLLGLAGVKVYFAFIWVTVLYFFLGAVGFYRLVRALTGDKAAAYFAFLVFLFSSAGIAMFLQVTFTMILVPSIWFFYFLIDFLRTQRRSSVLFMTWTLMILLTTYIPFYFINMAVLSAVVLIVFYFTRLKDLARQLWAFVRREPILALVCLAALGASALLPAMSWVTLRSDFIPMARPATMTYEIIQNGGIPVTELLRDFSLFSLLIHALHVDILSTARELFSLRNLPYDNHRILYIPLMAHLVLLSSVWTRAGRKFWSLAVLGCALFLLSVVYLSPVYKFLYDHVFYFKLFRNAFLMMMYLLCVYIILAAEQFRGLREQLSAKGKGRYFVLAWVLCVHAWFFFFLRSQANVLFSTQLTVLASFLYFVFYLFWGQDFRGKKVAFVMLVLLVLAQPADVLSRYARSALEGNSSIIAQTSRHPLTRPQLRYSRPSVRQGLYKGMTEDDIYHQFYTDIALLQDEPWFSGSRYGYPTSWAHRLVSKVPVAALEPYTLHKFVLYDAVSVFADKDLNFVQLGNDLSGLTNMAVLSQDQIEQEGLPVPALRPKAGIPVRAQVISGQGEGVQVIRFNVNEIKLRADLPSEKLLVYNDSYHPRWEVFVNGKRTDLYRANYAFKGVVLPAGENEILFRFIPYGGRYLYPFLWAMFLIFPFGAAVIMIREKKNG